VKIAPACVCRRIAAALDMGHDSMIGPTAKIEGWVGRTEDHRDGMAISRATRVPGFESQ
jgi:hypothetical protein